MGRIGNIINRKGKQDAKRASVFTKHARAITVAAREGGADPEYNAALKTAIDKAKADNMPNDNIKRAIDKVNSGVDESYIKNNPDANTGDVLKYAHQFVEFVYEDE